MKDVDAEYYGYRDEDDGVLLPLEAQYERQGTTGSASIVPTTDTAAQRVLVLLRVIIIW